MRVNMLDTTTPGFPRSRLHLLLVPRRWATIAAVTDMSGLIAMTGDSISDAEAL